MSRKIRLILFVGLSACATGLVVRAQERKGSQPPEWKPAPALLPKLDAETKVHDWAIRPPRGSMQKTVEKEAQIQYMWTSQTGMGVVVHVPRGPAGTMSLEASLDSAVKYFKARMPNFVTTRAERGTINGAPFIRARFVADAPADFPADAKALLGFLYVTQAGKHPVMIYAMAPPSEIELAEASAQTFRFVKPQATSK